MTRFLLLAGVAALAAAPAIAKPGGGHGPSMHANSHATTHVAPTPNAHANTHATTRTNKGHVRTISASDQALAHKYGGALCPPGLYKKTPSCMPPGQASRLFRTGQMVPTKYKYITPYGDIPSALVTQYGLTDQNRYIYRNNVIYVIDPVTNRVTRVINGVL